jgi:hypothetical protein
MTPEEEVLLEKYGITAEPKIVYLYKGFRYDHFKDALNYAILDAEKRKPVVK